MATKTKVTVTLDGKLLEALDAHVSNGQRSRSAFIEDVLRQWKRQCDREREDREIEEYYRTMSNAEREEDRRWVEGAGRDIAKIWGHDPGWEEEWRRIQGEAKSTLSSSRTKATRGRRSSSQ